MISIMSERELDRKSVAAAAADRCFLGRPSYNRDADPDVGGFRSRLDHVDRRADLGETVSEDGRQRRFDFPSVAATEIERARSSDPNSRGVGAASAGAEDGVSAASSGVARTSLPRLMNGFEIGDMVWGKVKSHPWWPGQIYNEAFASPSVRRARRDGHILVAFFGDSSYGWFDPRELIPFDSNFEEKSRQTTARAFLKAVEESLDEAARRGALAFTCSCRGPRRNFRPIGVPGCLAVDVPGYESSGIYTLDQIKKARDRFVPMEMLSFVLQLSVAPLRGSEAKGVHWIQSIAMLLAHRRVVFEEFDETYAQAFGVQPVRPSQNDAMAAKDQQEKFALRAIPLSGQLVTAEALADQSPGAAVKQIHNVSKAAKVSLAKKKYVLKPREETPVTTQPRPSLPHLHQPQGASSGFFPALQQNARYFPQRPAAPSRSSAVDNYVLQKRFPATTPAEAKLDDEKSSNLSSTRAMGSHEPQRLIVEVEPGSSGMVVMEKFEVHAQPRSRGMDGSKMDVTVDLPVAMVDAANVLRQDGRPDMNIQGAFDSAASKQELPKRANEPLVMDSMPSMGKAHKAKAVAGVVLKKLKPLKRKHEDNVPYKDGVDVKKKKKMMKKLGSQAVQSHITKISKDGQPHRKPAAKATVLGSGQAGCSLDELRRRDGAEVSQTSGFPVPSAQHPKVDFPSLNLQLPELVDDLSALALDPFYGSERNAPSIVCQVFLKFRLLVYQKSLVLPPASEPETAEFRASKLAAGSSLQGPSTASEEKEPSSSAKPWKRSLKPDDVSIAGRKRGPSDRQEELSAKKAKKLETIKALAAEKKANIAPKTCQGQQRDQKDTCAMPTAKLNKTESVRKPEPSPLKIPSPTWVVMKFPPNTTLPSVASLKARFARFGQLDLDGTRVYWKSFSCKVLFKHRVDALSAYSYVKSNDLFGQIKVNYSIREVELPAQEPTEPQKPQPELRPNDVLQFRPGNGDVNNNSMSQLKPPLHQQPQWQQSVQLKSCLKKRSDEFGVAKETPRVKFMLDGDAKEEPPMVLSNNNHAGNGSTDGPSFSSKILDTPLHKNSNSISFVPPQPSSLPPPLLPNRPPVTPTPLDMHRHLAPPPFLYCFDGNQGRGLPRFTEAKFNPRSVQSVGLAQNSVDISGQMLSLLTRCNNIVMNIKSALGYVPYHSL